MYLVSIVVPVYNVEKYIRKCIDSLINQTLKNIEIILVNDGSKDSSGKICDNYADLDKRIKVIHKQNGGLSDARNHGIEIANGKYIAFVDSDDWVEVDMFETLYNIAEKENSDIVQCNFNKVYSEDESIINPERKEITSYSSEQFLTYLDSVDKGEQTVIVCNKIYNRNLFKNIKFPISKINEDEFTTYKLIYKANKIIEVNSCFYNYRQRENSIMNSNFSIKRLDILNALEERKEYFEYVNLPELAIKTDVTLCNYLKKFYSLVFFDDIENKKCILKRLKLYMIKNYFRFIFNNQISVNGKLSLTLCILNGKIFSKLY